MHRINTILFSAYYLVLVTGLSINIHSCLGEIENITIAAENNSCCCEGNEMSANCCDDMVLLQFSPDEQLVKSENTSFKFQIPEIVIEIQKYIVEPDVVTRKPVRLVNSSPPKSVPIWLRNSNFTFYG